MYIGCIAGIVLISDNYERLKDKKLIVFTVGLTDPADKKKYDDLITKNFTWTMKDTIPAFHPFLPSISAEHSITKRSGSATN